MAISTRELKRNVETQIKEMQREQEDFIKQFEKESLQRTKPSTVISSEGFGIKSKEFKSVSQEQARLQKQKSFQEKRLLQEILKATDPKSRQDLFERAVAQQKQKIQLSDLQKLIKTQASTSEVMPKKSPLLSNLIQLVGGGGGVTQAAKLGGVGSNFVNQLLGQIKPPSQAAAQPQVMRDPATGLKITQMSNGSFETMDDEDFALPGVLA